MPTQVKVNGLPLAPLADALAKGNSEKRLSELKNGNVVHLIARKKFIAELYRINMRSELPLLAHAQGDWR